MERLVDATIAGKGEDALRLAAKLQGQQQRPASHDMDRQTTATIIGRLGVAARSGDTQTCRACYSELFMRNTGQRNKIDEYYDLNSKRESIIWGLVNHLNDREEPLAFHAEAPRQPINDAVQAYIGVEH